MDEAEVAAIVTASAETLALAGVCACVTAAPTSPRAGAKLFTLDPEATSSAEPRRAAADPGSNTAPITTALTTAAQKNLRPEDRMPQTSPPTSLSVQSSFTQAPRSRATSRRVLF